MESFFLKLQKSDHIGRDFVDYGFKFRPNDIKLVGYYLGHKINGLSYFCEFMFKDCDLFGTQEPWEVWASHPLADEEEELHFFTHLKKKSANAIRTARKVGTGTWHCESTEQIMYYEEETDTDNVLGERRRFLYKNEGSVHHKGWLLHEFKLADVSTDIVVCRLKKNIHGKRSRQESSCLRAEKVIRTKKQKMETLQNPSPGMNSSSDADSRIEQTENPNVVGSAVDGKSQYIDGNLMSVDAFMDLMNSVPDEMPFTRLACGEERQFENLFVVDAPSTTFDELPHLISFDESDSVPYENQVKSKNDIVQRTSPYLVHEEASVIKESEKPIVVDILDLEEWDLQPIDDDMMAIHELMASTNSHDDFML